METRSQLTNNPMWKRFKPFIGMSRSAYRIAYFENALFWGDPDDLFIQRMLGSAEDYLLRYALLEMRVGRKTFSPQVTQPIAGGLEELYCKTFCKVNSFILRELHDEGSFKERMYVRLAQRWRLWNDFCTCSICLRF